MSLAGLAVTFAVAAVAAVIGVGGGVAGPMSAVAGPQYIVSANDDPCLISRASLTNLFPGREFEPGMPSAEYLRRTGQPATTAVDGCFFAQTGVPMPDSPLAFMGDSVRITRFHDMVATDPASTQFLYSTVARDSQPGPRSGLPIQVNEDRTGTVPLAVGGTYCAAGQDFWTIEVAFDNGSRDQIFDGIDRLLSDIGCSAPGS